MLIKFPSNQPFLNLTGHEQLMPFLKFKSFQKAFEPAQSHFPEFRFQQEQKQTAG